MMNCAVLQIHEESYLDLKARLREAGDYREGGEVLDMDGIVVRADPSTSNYQERSNDPERSTLFELAGRRAVIEDFLKQWWKYKREKQRDPHEWTERDFTLAWDLWTAGHHQGYADGTYCERKHFIPSWKHYGHYGKHHMGMLWLWITRRYRWLTGFIDNR